MQRPAPAGHGVKGGREAFREVRVFAPGTVSNLGCGFDVFGLALEGPGDEVVARRAQGTGIVALSVIGEERIPRDPARNAAAAAAQAVLDRLAPPAGISLVLHKGLPLASGLGGSAASAVAGAVATNALLGGDLNPTSLLECALVGEERGSGAKHPDNAAPSLAGGFVLVPPGEPLRIVRIPTPADLTVAVVHPHIEVETARARRMLGDTISLEAGIRQWGNTAGLVAGLYREDWELIGRCTSDAVAEPVRAELVPAFRMVRSRALEAGAAGAGLSGSGPSLFALCRGRPAAERVAEAMTAAFREEAELDSDFMVSPVSGTGVRIKAI